MIINKIGIIGNGFVGNAIYENLKDYIPISIYDKQVDKSHNSLEETFKSDLIFICLPTPMTDVDGGDCNLRIIEDFFSSIPKSNSIFIIKSTIPIGTTQILKNKRKDLKIIHNPEFLTALNAVSDFKNSERNILGGDKQECEIVATFFKSIFPNMENIIVSSNESETIKYFANSFLALKVTYFNILYDLSERFGMSYENIVKGICLDPRIGFSHTKTPGTDGERGFGGACFPKDINALISTLKRENINFSVLEAAWEYNKKIRKNWDWASNSSAVCNKL